MLPLLLEFIVTGTRPCSGVFGRLNGRKIESVALPEHIDVLQRLINQQDFRKAEEKMSTANQIKERFNKV
jgi:hypothetical protein